MSLLPRRRPRRARQGAEVRRPRSMPAMDEQAAALADGIEAALPGWVERSVERLVGAWGGSIDESVRGQAAEAGRRAAAEVGPQVRSLLEADVDTQWTNPLSLVRAAVRYPTAVLRDAGVPP